MGRSRTKTALSVALLLASGALAAWAMRGGPDLPRSCVFVCVATGKTFNLKIDDVAMIPAKNPETGARTLLPCGMGEDGVLRVDAHYRGALVNLLGGVNRHVNMTTLEVGPGDGS